jgi:DNA-binding LacI/PurR family transcriptional regulator
MHRPPLTTVAVGAREIGEEAARLLPRGIKSPKVRPKASSCHQSSSFVQVAAQDRQSRE